MSTIQHPSVLSEHLAMILEYYETEEGLVHQKVDLYAYLTPPAFTPHLLPLKEQFPTYQFTYTKLEKDKSYCKATAADLSIKIPVEVLAHKTGSFRYDFQSHLKNTFGTLTVEVTVNNDTWTSENKQFFTTSIGH